MRSKDKKVIYSYAKGLLRAIIHLDLINECYEEIKNIEDLIEDSNLYDFIKNPLIRKESKLEVLIGLLGETKPFIIDFLRVVFDNKREIFLKEIIKEFYKQFNEFKKINYVVVETPIELTESQKNRIRREVEKLVKGKLIINEIINKNIIGGYVIKINDYLIDNSIDRKLNDIYKIIIN